MAETGIFPVLAEPLPPVEPDTYYDEVMYSLVMNPATTGKKPDIALVITARPFRRLADGSIDVAPRTLEKRYHVASCKALKQAGQPAAMQCAKGIMAEIETYIASLTAGV